VSWVVLNCKDKNWGETTLRPKIFFPAICLLIAICAKTAGGASILVDQEYQQAVNIIVMDQSFPGDAESFRRVVVNQIQQGKWIGLVKVFSPGGSTYDGIEIGRQIRTLRASTVAPTRLTRPAGVNFCLTMSVSGGAMQFNPATRKGDSRCVCTSACFLIWAGGWGREGDVVGVHRMRWEDFNFQSTTQANDMYSKAISDVSEYLRSMDVPDNVIRISAVTASSSMYFLTKAELALLLGQPPGIDEMKAARCGRLSRTATPGRVTTPYYDCVSVIYEQESRVGSEQFMKVYGSKPLTDIYR
jgi:hypothetical protein